MWGDRITLSPSFRSGLSMDRGSSSKTSSTAPEITSFSSAWTRSGSSTQYPREVLMKMASFFICANCSFPIMWRVSLVRTTWRVTTSDSRRSVA